MLHVFAREGFEDQPTARPQTKQAALVAIRTGAPVTVATRGHLPRLKSGHEKDRSFVALSPDKGEVDDQYFLQAQFHDLVHNTRTAFVFEITLCETGPKLSLVDPDDVEPKEEVYDKPLTFALQALDAFNDLLVDLNGPEDPRNGWISDQDRRVLAALVSSGPELRLQMEEKLARACQHVAAELASVAQAHADRAALWVEVPLGALLFDIQQGSFARKIAPIGKGEHDAYVLPHPDFLDGYDHWSDRTKVHLMRHYGLSSVADLRGALLTESTRNLSDHRQLCAPYIRGSRELRGVEDPSSKFEVKDTARHLSFMVPPEDWKADGDHPQVAVEHVWQIGGVSGESGIPKITPQMLRDADSDRRVARAVGRRVRGLGIVQGDDCFRDFVVSRRVLARLQVLDPHRAWHKESTDRPPLPNGMYYLDCPSRRSGIRFDPEFLIYRWRDVNPFDFSHRDQDTLPNDFSWRYRGYDPSAESDCVVVAPPDMPLPPLWRATDFGRFDFDYVFMSDALMLDLSAKGLLDGVTRARVGLIQPGTPTSAF
ncbi:MAG: hypothetical protein AB3N23_04830 [Paracoccaceae bacterium]